MVESIGVFQQRYVVMLYISSKRMRVEMNKKRLLDQSRSLKVALDGKHQNTKHYQQAWDGHRESKLYNAGLSFQGTNTKIQTLSLQS